tara:strand:+ start:108 stop:362 length:255 start_codon:yes stop_codon:yes gene_type:complete
MSAETGYYVLTVATRDGEHEYTEKWAVILDVVDDKMPIDEWLKEFYGVTGEGDWKYCEDDYRLVFMKSYREVTQEEFYILKKYL